jgi:hypothetical protein
VERPYRYWTVPPDAKGKPAFSSNSKLAEQPGGSPPAPFTQTLPRLSCNILKYIAKNSHLSEAIMAGLGFRRSLIVQIGCGILVYGSILRCRSLQKEREAMKRTLMALATVATLVTAVAAPQAAEARGGRIAAGIAGGLIGGALLGGALAGPGYYYGPGYYGYGPAYYGPGYGYYGGPAYVAAPGCYWQRQRFWDGYGWRLRRVRVCG